MSTDPAEPRLVLTLDAGTVPLEAVQRAVYALAARLSATVHAVPGGWEARIHPREPIADLEELAHRFRDEVMDQVLRLRISAETEGVRNLVFAVAFSRTGLLPSEEEFG